MNDLLLPEGAGEETVSLVMLDRFINYVRVFLLYSCSCLWRARRLLVIFVHSPLSPGGTRETSPLFHPLSSLSCVLHN